MKKNIIILLLIVIGVFLSSCNTEKKKPQEPLENKKEAYKRETSTKKLPVLTLHDIGEGQYAISEEQLRRQLSLLKNQGYQAISLGELYKYTEDEIELPPKPLLITFDDGYMSNYTKAFPILKDLDMRAVFFVIGSSFGKDEYKDTGHPIIPHFGLEEAKEMVESGYVEIQSHTFDMHQSEDIENNRPVRFNMHQFSEESDEDYARAIKKDFELEDKLIRSIHGHPTHSLSYPRGFYSEKTEVLLRELGVKSTFTTEEGINTIIKGEAKSLYLLKRVNIDRNLSDEDLLDKIQENVEE